VRTPIWTKGYSQAELDRAQDRYGLAFPSDLTALWLEKRLVDGHDLNDEVAMRRVLAGPFEGLLFDVETCFLWWPEWGERPASPDARAEVLRGVVAGAPKLIPLYSHRYLPAAPNKAGNPVFSIHQSDIIYYGSDLENYFEREIVDPNTPLGETIRQIPFWSELADRFGQDRWWPPSIRGN